MLEDLFNGASKKLQLKKNILCPHCEGCVDPRGYGKKKKKILIRTAPV